ncbi:MAG: bifunctional oligoribonuclease/PAP phosphatase NrnA [Proteobacteria bacterium]|nr:bifunctional oligoribonuclease/PAP phosphatase NrnA [Pseudomonadota bacterium]
MIEEIRQLIDKGNKFLITTHMDPDGDALGSSFSMYYALEALGKKATVFLKDPVPYMYRFLPKPLQMTHEFPVDQYDAIFVLDCGNLYRVGDGFERLKGMGAFINIDHHRTSEAFGVVNLIDEHASSTAEILYGLFRALKIPITFDMAINIYTAIFTDTGSFRYDNTGSSAFLICEEMTRLGVKPAYVSQMVHENHPKERFWLLGLVFSTMETYYQDKVAIACVTEEMFKKTNTDKDYSDGFVEYFREIRGVEAAILIREINKQRYKISMRSKGFVDVAAICGFFGGGGHKNAAGCTMDGTLEEVKNKLNECFLKEFI